VREFRYHFERHLEQGHWGNVPEHLARWYKYNKEQATFRERHELIMEAAEMLRQAMDERLTERQRDTLSMFFFEGYTQVEIAKLLGISQPTVHQHVSGKLRRGRRVGGGIQKLRKTFKRELALKDSDRTRVATILVELIPTCKRPSTVPALETKRRR